MLNSILSASVLDTVHVCLVCDSFWDILLHARPLQKQTFTKLSWYVRCSPSLDWNQSFAGCRQLTVRVDFFDAAVIDIGNFADIIYYCRESYIQGYLLWVVLIILSQVFVMIIVQRWVLLQSSPQLQTLILGSFFCLRVWRGGNIVPNRSSSIDPSLDIVSGGNWFIVTIIVSSGCCYELNACLIPRSIAQDSGLCDSIR
jgi:hypothetical protein